MGDGADELAILNYRTPGHSLNDTAGLIYQPGIGDSYRKTFVSLRVSVYIGDLYRIFLRCTFSDRANYISVSAVDVVPFAYGKEHIAPFGESREGPEHTAGGVHNNGPGLGTREVAVKLTR